MFDLFPNQRYFVLEKGILKYAKRGPDVSIIIKTIFLRFHKIKTQDNTLLRLQMKKGKLHGCIDVGLSVMSIKKKVMCIDLDTENNIYHLKVNPEQSKLW